MIQGYDPRTAQPAGDPGVPLLGQAPPDHARSGARVR